jgi:hypothetical protein
VVALVRRLDESEFQLPATESGTYGFSVRVVPTHPCLMQAHELRLITRS